MESESDSIYAEYLDIFQANGGDLAGILESLICNALNPSNNGSEFIKWLLLLIEFLTEHKYQISDQNKWDLYQSHPGYDNVENCYRQMLNKYPYLHFRYGEGGGRRAFEKVIVGTNYNHFNLERRLAILKLLVLYWPNHRYSYRQRDDETGGENGYFFMAYFLGPEFRAVLDPNNEVYTEAWFRENQDRLEAWRLHLVKTGQPVNAAPVATQTANEAVVLPVPCL